jgi:hypothetical protein
MADNVAITAGAGTNISTDQLASGAHVQHFKLMDGTADSTTVAVVDSRGHLAVDANGTTDFATFVAGISQTPSIKVGGYQTVRLDATLGASGNIPTFQVSYDNEAAYVTAVLYSDVDCTQIAPTLVINTSGNIRYVDVTNATHLRCNNTTGSATHIVNASLTSVIGARGLRQATKVSAVTTMGALNAACTVYNLDGEMWWVAQGVGNPTGGTLVIEGSNDNSSWTNIAAVTSMPTSGATWSNTPGFSNNISWPSSNNFWGPTMGYKHIRLRLSAYTSGSGTMTMRALYAYPYPAPLSTTVTSATAANFNATVIANGGVASGAADSGNPVKVGGIVATGAETAASNGNRVNARFDSVGRQVVQPYNHRERATASSVTLTSTTETTLLAAGGASVFTGLTSLSLFNASATSVIISLRVATGGTVIGNYVVPAGGGAVIPLPLPIYTAANANITVQSSGAVSSIYVNAVGFYTL